MNTTDKIWHLEHGEEESKLFADCEITVDTNKINEDDFGTKDVTLEQYLSEYVEGHGTIKDLDYAWITINDAMRNTFDRIKDLTVFDGMKIFIHSEVF